MPEDTTTPAYRQPVIDVLTSLGVDVTVGLSAAEARARLAQYGRNELAGEEPTPWWKRLLEQFQDMLVVLLLVATAISAAVWLWERDSALPYEAMAIFAIVLLNAVMGLVQTSRAEQAIASLRAMSPPLATVLRDGKRDRIPAAELVPGDILLVEEGDTIGADGRLIESNSLKMAEAALTGESLPVGKDTEAIAEEALLGDRDNMIFSGTVAAFGRGTAVVVTTGMRTEMGHIAGLLKRTRDEATPLQRELDRTGKLLGVAVMGIAVVMVATLILAEHVRGFSAIVDVLIFGVALAVAAVPEGLPAVVTAVLSLGVQRMAGRNAIVRRLAAVETLGSATVIASDKTGTLTKNEMTVRTVVTASGVVNLAGERIMENPPRPRSEKVITGRMWLGIVFVGVVMAAATLFMLDYGLPGGLVDRPGNMRYAQTLAFTTLMLLQVFNIFNARSEEESAFVNLFSNRWLWLALGFSLMMQAAVVYVPALQQAFSTTALSGRDWLLCAGVASSVLWLRELSKVAVRWTESIG